MQILKTLFLLTILNLSTQHGNERLSTPRGRRRNHSARHFGMNPYGQGYHPQAFHANFENRGNHWSMNGYNLNNYGDFGGNNTVGLDGLNMNLTTDRYYTGNKLQRRRFNKPSEYYFNDFTSNPFVYSGYSNHNQQP